MVDFDELPCGNETAEPGVRETSVRMFFGRR